MRIINREQFLKLPAGTVYCNYKPTCVEELLIKSDSLTNDWYYQDIALAVDADSSEEAHEMLYDAEHHGVHIQFNFYSEYRDGCFNDNQLFTVWDKEDVEALIKRLKETLV